MVNFEGILLRVFQLSLLLRRFGLWCSVFCDALAVSSVSAPASCVRRAGSGVVRIDPLPFPGRMSYKAPSQVGVYNHCWLVKSLREVSTG